MQPDDFFSAVDERCASGSPYLRFHYGISVKQMTREEAGRILHDQRREVVNFNPETIVAAMEGIGLTQSTLARAALISQPWLSKAIRNRRGELATVTTVCDYLVIPIEEVVCD